MPRTYGEVLPSSFPDILALGGKTDKVLVDFGSGHGLLVKAAVEQYGCNFAIGVEKYKEPAAIAAKLFSSSSSDLQAKMRFLVEDMSDTDIPKELQGLQFDTIILFCNNLAFHDGTVHRVPWRLAVWYKQTHDQRLLPLLQAQQRFFEGQDLISAGYRLNGKPSQKYTNICFLAPVLCLFKVMGSKRIQHIEKEIQRERTAGRATYFGESMELIGELQLQQL